MAAQFAIHFNHHTNTYAKLFCESISYIIYMFSVFVCLPPQDEHSDNVRHKCIDYFPYTCHSLNFVLFYHLLISYIFKLQLKSISENNVNARAYITLNV